MNKLVRKIMDSPKSFRYVELGADISEEVQRFSGWEVPS
jgi:UDP-3-O-[3-hydroxymyristoyl] N-acetylglucosamine deacetylase